MMYKKDVDSITGKLKLCRNCECPFLCELNNEWFCGRQEKYLRNVVMCLKWSQYVKALGKKAERLRERLEREHRCD